MIHAAFLFPGQGSHYLGMGYSLYNSFSEAKAVFEEADSILKRPLSRICFSGSPGELGQPENMLPAIFVLSIAAYRVLMKICGILPVVAAGHSLGEYSALVCCGLLSFSDALLLIEKRAAYAKEMMLAENAIMMVVDGIPTAIVESICSRYKNGDVSIGCYNTPEQCVLCGHKIDLMKIKALLRDYPASFTPLFYSPPFHCSMMYQVADRFAEDLDRISLAGNVSFPVIANVTARPYLTASDIPTLLKSQLTMPVQWKSVIDQIKTYDCQCVLQIGGRSISTGLGINRLQVPVACVNIAEDIEHASRMLQGLPFAMNKDFIQSITSQCLAVAVSTKNYTPAISGLQQKLMDRYQKLVSLDQIISASECCTNTLELNEIIDDIMRIKNIPDQEYSQYMMGMFNN